MIGRRDLAVVGNLADVPQQRDPLAAVGEGGDGLVAADGLEGGDVLRRRRLDQPLAGRRLIEARLQIGERGEIEVAVAPLHGLDGVETMGLERLDKGVVKGVDAAGDAEGAVAQMTAGAAGDLAEFGRRQAAELVAVKLAVGGEGDVVDVEVEAHADGVGGDQEIDVAGLEYVDLGVAGARAERAEDDGGAAALTADQLGDGVDLVGGEGDHRRAAGQAGDLLRAGIGQQRHARAGDDVHAGQQLLDDAAHGGGAEQQGLLAAAQVEQAVGEDVTAFEVGGELDLVDRQERRVGCQRHRLDRAHAKRGAGGTIFSSPVISATWSAPTRAATLV